MVKTTFALVFVVSAVSVVTLVLAMKDIADYAYGAMAVLGDAE